MRRLVFALAAALALSCAPAPTELGPVEALTSFLVAIDQSTHAPEQRKFAFEWLDGASQTALKERAELTASLAGRELGPWEMLVPGRLNFPVRSLAGVKMRAVVDGDRATVRIPVEKGEPVEVPMVREGGRWRVVLGLTPLTPTSSSE